MARKNPIVARVHRFIGYFEDVISVLLMLMVAVVVAVATIDMGYVLVKKMVGPGHLIESFAELPEIFGIFLLVLIGLELLETLKSYNGGHRVRVTMVLLAAMIALARKIIIIEPDKYSGETLLGMAALILALAVALYLWWRTEIPDEAFRPAAGEDPGPSACSDGGLEPLAGRDPGPADPHAAGQDTVAAGPQAAGKAEGG
jgi:uncharacterized membrane protein (DUF373 family)